MLMHRTSGFDPRALHLLKAGVGRAFEGLDAVMNEVRPQEKGWKNL
ncbi:MAG: hypothetical protein R6U38_15265 [Desulfatiglandaceae bacterium]